MQNEEDEDHVEHRGQTAADEVEGDLNVFEAEIVEDDHRDEHDGQWQRFAGHVYTELDLGKVDQLEGGRSEEPIDQREEHRDRDRAKALKERDEQRCVQGESLVAEDVLVNEDHQNGDQPVEEHDQNDLQVLQP